MMVNSQMENTKVQYLKNIEKSLLLNNKDNSLNEVINNVQSLIAQCSINNPPVHQHNNHTKFQVNNKNEDILKYKSYLDFLNFRKNKILKSINEFQYNFDININKLNENLEKTNKDIEKYTLLLNNLENNNLEDSSNVNYQLSQEPVNQELNSLENNQSSSKNNKETVIKKEKNKNKKQELKEEKTENNLKISDFLNNLNEEDNNSTSNNNENNNIETFNQFVNSENENNDNSEVKEKDDNLLNILGNIVDNLN